MSREIDLLWKQLDDAFRPVVAGARATVSHLKEWTGEYPAAASGAAPDSAGPAPSANHDDDHPDDDREPVRLSKIEACALGHDATTSKLRLIFRLVDELVAGTTRLAGFVPGDMLPRPAPRLEARVAYVQLQINRCRQATGVTWPTSDVRRIAARADHLSRLITLNAPARLPSGVPAGGCVSHARAGEWADVDDRYRRHDLCRRCGEFRHLFGQLPPKKLVAWAEKHGWRSATSAANLTKFHVNGANRKRRAG